MIKLIVSLLILSNLALANHWVYKGIPSDVLEMDRYFDRVIDKGRVQVFGFKTGFNMGNIPSKLLAKIKPIDLKNQLYLKTSHTFVKQTVSTEIVELINKLSIEQYQKTLEWVTSFGPRSTNESRMGILYKLREYGYNAIEDYNIEAFKRGTVDPEKFVIIEAHMDTVRRTMGADDNGSGTAALLEAARILKDVPTKYSILFLVTEDEEIGLRGAKYKVKQLKEQGKLKDLLFVANMDMIAYRESDLFDIETEPEFKDLAGWVAQQAVNYTDLEPNILLNAWGADHVPFIEAGVPTVLTIEHWNNHNPCYHQPCDNLDLVDWGYATEIAKLNIALIALKAELI